MEDQDGKGRLLAERKELVKRFEDETIKWINGEGGRDERDSLAQKLGDNYWALDPYLRARSLYDRFGVIGPGGKIDFYPERKPN